MVDPKRIRFVASADDQGKRLDQVLAAHVDGLSRRKARVLIDIGGVFVEGRRLKVAGRKVRSGQKIEAVLGAALERATATPGRDARARDEESLPEYAVLHEDEHIIVVEKPARLLTAPTPESDRNNLADLLARRGQDKQQIFVVHRLDLATSGVLVMAKTELANRVLSERFRNHDLDRQYLVVVAGSWPEDVVSVSEPVDGKHARTHFQVEERIGDKATVLRARLDTGRTHQIRLHCAHVGHPVLGDRRYGGESELHPPRMALHASVLAFPHPETSADLRFERPWPEAVATWLDELRG